MSDTYRYVGTTWRRKGETLTHGALVEPTEAELTAFGHQLVRVDDDADAAQTDADADSAQTDADAAPDDMADDAVIEAAGYDPGDYNALRSAASEYDAVNGAAAHDDLVEQLAEALR